ncbi:hypothetical protein AVEN_8929-1 [Araneus ventricosus]|uniref:Uncharacterized protein n=1 Tax=Araneus ventricosus TaxID=182803 RepID=A0A4Y2DH57_ARAVE|nr:hypothetical protein AVEN_8929-1 [Araneus ventricosus]
MPASQQRRVDCRILSKAFRGRLQRLVGVRVDGGLVDHGSRSPTRRNPGYINRVIVVAMGRVQHAQSIKAQMFCSSSRVRHGKNDLKAPSCWNHIARRTDAGTMSGNTIFPPIQSGW